jgi:class 3 adenylate cyclase/predicted ATPase/ribosomal protein L40E
MRCSKCGTNNPPDNSFCAQCGNALVRICVKCGAESPPTSNFCGKCGAPLDAAAIRANAEPRDHGLTGERRHLTVLFCDLVGSTEIAAKLDPEEWRETVSAYHRAAAEAVTRYGGHVAKYLGDGVMAYFGWPEAHENDAERATRAGLAVLKELSKLNQQPTHPKVSVRVGIDSGTVVVGAGAGKDTDVFGEAPNIAARVQAAAAPDTVLLTASTHRLVSGLFVVEELGAQQLRGVADPVELYRVLRPTGVRGRLAAARGLTPFVGREEELRPLLSRWERTCDGEGQLVLLIGEPGIGKSRLVLEFHSRIRDARHIWMETGGEQFFENTPFHAISEMLTRWLELQDATTADEQFQRLERALALAGQNASDAAPLIADLLQLPAGSRYLASFLTAEQKRRRLLGALSGWVLGAARMQPVVMVVEDLHWLDPSTLELLQLLAEQGSNVPLLLVYTARPEFRAPWPMRTHHTHVAVSHLSSRNAREMVGLLAERNSLSGESVDTVVERAAGVPLFVEELTRAVLEARSMRSTGAIPETLHDSLMARLDRVGSAKEVIQIGAVLGGEFSYELIRAVHPIGEQDLSAALSTAIEADLIYTRGTAPDATYQFKHALIRDSAYEALLKSRRKELHGLVARTIDEKFSSLKEARPELLARHWTEAGLIEQAIPYWQQAGQRAAERSANVEAISHLTKGLTLLDTLPPTPENSRRELAMQLTLGGSLSATRGFGSAEVEHAYDRARELCQRLDNSREIFPVLFGLWGYYDVRANLREAREVGERLLTAAQAQQDPALLVMGCRALGETFFWLGEVGEARAHLERATVCYDPQQHRRLCLIYGHDPGSSSLGFAALTLWVLGYPDQALCRSQKALALAQQLSHPFSLVFTLMVTTYLHQFRREAHAVLATTKKLLELAARHGFAQALATGTRYRGWALTVQGEREEGMALMRQGSDAFLATGAGVSRPYVLALLAEALGNLGRNKEGLLAFPEALGLIEKNNDRVYEAELYRIKGELILQSESHNVLEAGWCFQKAIEVARLQNAKSWELRATLSLARLLAKQRRRRDAAMILTKIYNWFTEGFDTADLQDAKKLLDELSA